MLVQVTAASVDGRIGKRAAGVRPPARSGTGSRTCSRATPTTPPSARWGCRRGRRRSAAARSAEWLTWDVPAAILGDAPIPPRPRTAGRAAGPAGSGIVRCRGTSPRRTDPAVSPRPRALDQRAYLVDPGLPDPQRLLVRHRVRPAVGAVADRRPHARRLELAERLAVGDHRLLRRRQLDAGEARPRKALEPRRVRRVARVDLGCGRAHGGRVPPAWKRCGTACGPTLERRPRRGVAAVAVDDQEAAEALAVERVERLRRRPRRASPGGATPSRGTPRSPARSRTASPAATGTPSGSAASTETRSARIESVAEREVGVLLGRADRQDDAIVVAVPTIAPRPASSSGRSRPRPTARQASRGGLCVQRPPTIVATTCTSGSSSAGIANGSRSRTTRSAR